MPSEQSSDPPLPLSASAPSPTPFVNPGTATEPPRLSLDELSADLKQHKTPCTLPPASLDFPYPSATTSDSSSMAPTPVSPPPPTPASQGFPSPTSEFLKSGGTASQFLNTRRSPPPPQSILRPEDLMAAMRSREIHPHRNQTATSTDTSTDAALAVESPPQPLQLSSTHAPHRKMVFVQDPYHHLQYAQPVSPPPPPPPVLHAARYPSPPAPGVHPGPGVCAGAIVAQQRQYPHHQNHGRSLSFGGGGGGGGIRTTQVDIHPPGYAQDPNAQELPPAGGGETAVRPDASGGGASVGPAGKDVGLVAGLMTLWQKGRGWMEEWIEGTRRWG